MIRRLYSGFRNSIPNTKLECEKRWDSVAFEAQAFGPQSCSFFQIGGSFRDPEDRRRLILEDIKILQEGYRVRLKAQEGETAYSNTEP